MFGLLGSILTGGATGLLGSIVSGVFGFMNKKLDIQKLKLQFDQAVSLKQLDMQIGQMEWANKIKVQEIVSDAEVQVEDSKTLRESLWKEPDRYSDPSKMGSVGEAIMEMLDFFRGLIRPALTVYLCALTTVIYYKVHAAGGNLSLQQAYEMYAMVIETILYLTTTCVLWWFGSRMNNKVLKSVFN